MIVGRTRVLHVLLGVAFPFLPLGCDQNDETDSHKSRAPDPKAHSADAKVETSSKSGSADSDPAHDAKEKPPQTDLDRLRLKIDQFVPVELTADVSDLPASEREALDHLIEAARLLDPVFNRQVWAGYDKREKELAAQETELEKAQYTYFQIMRGPWDRQAEDDAFAIQQAHPKGAGFYPEDLDEAEFAAYVEAHPKKKAALESLVTVVERKDEELIAVPYSRAYAQWLEPAAEKLEAAAAATKNQSLRKFLQLRAKAFRTDDYYLSDKAWMDLDSRVEITIGPYETYEDKLLGKKAAFEAFVTISDPEASEKLARYKQRLPDMEQHLPVDDAVKTKRGAESPIRVVDLVFTSGDARKSVQTIAFNLPNDERVRKEKGAKKVMLRNAINTKFDAIMKPIAERVIASEQLKWLDQDAFFNEVLFHELSHSLGPAFVGGDEKKGEVKAALGASYAALEEAKADVMGAYNILFMIAEGDFPIAEGDSAEGFRHKLLLTYFAGLFRSVRFGVSEAHGKGAALQINRFLEEKAAVFDQGSGTYEIDFDQLEKSIEGLVHDIVMWQHAGDKAVVDGMFDKYGVVSPTMKQALEKLEGIPVDIRPRYPLAGE